jgi:hypothetical protein
MKGYTVFNVEQIDGSPEIYYAKAASTLDPVARIEHAEKFLHATGAKIATAETAPTTASRPTPCRCRRLKHSAMPTATIQRSRMS